MFSNFFSLLIIAARRVWNQRLLMLCLLAGLIVAVGILSSIPLYADAVQQRLMQGELTEAGTLSAAVLVSVALHRHVEWQYRSG